MKRVKLITGALLIVTVMAMVAASVVTVKNFSVQKADDEMMVVSNITEDGKVLKSANEIEYLQKSGKKKKNKKNTVVIGKKKRYKTTKAKKASKKDKKKYIGTFKVTGYCGCSACCGKSTGITASGTRATAGRTIAADTSRYPFGTKMIINGHTYKVEDRGGAINGNKIDIYFSSHSEALRWGVRYCDVYTK